MQSKNILPHLKAMFSSQNTVKRVGQTLVMKSNQAAYHKRTMTLATGALLMNTFYQSFSSSFISNDHHILYSQSGNQGGNQGNHNQQPQGNNNGPQGGNDHSGAAHANQDNQNKDVKVNRHIDQTVLKGGTTWDEVKKVCSEALQYDFIAVCIPPCFVKEAKEFLKGSNVQIATVIGFPFGNTTTEVKVFETRQAVDNGADEIDMVINIGWLKSGEYDKVGHEIKVIKEACGSKLLKVIVETGYLTEQEIAKVTHVVDSAGADFIKTSTGFGPRGASLRDIEIFRENSKRLQIKAAGGVRDREAALKYIELGASRIGTSSGMNLIKTETENAVKTAQAGIY